MLKSTEFLCSSSALLEAQEIFGLDFDPAELDQLEGEGLGSDEEGEEGEGEEEEVRGKWEWGIGMLSVMCSKKFRTENQG